KLSDVPATRPMDDRTGYGGLAAPGVAAGPTNSVHTTGATARTYSPTATPIGPAGCLLRGRLRQLLRPRTRGVGRSRTPTGSGQCLRASWPAQFGHGTPDRR